MNKKFFINSKILNEYEGVKHKISENYDIFNVATINNPENNSLIFANDLNEEVILKLKSISECVLIINEKYCDMNFPNNVVLFVKEPRKEYAKILKFILTVNTINNRKTFMKDGYVLGDNVSIGSGTIIEPFVFIEHDVVVGKNCIIKTGAKIRKYTTIGDDCIVRENCVIGGEGFGVERDEDGTTYKIPHLGGVRIGNNVEIGALTSVASGTIHPTIIEDFVKIDDCVFIAHNCKIDEGSYVIANAEISGSVHIGRCSWIGPSSSIINTVSIGKNSIVGIGAVVTKDVNENAVVAGNPADSIEIIKKIRRLQKNLLQNYD